jgi:hypothetical protein
MKHALVALFLLTTPALAQTPPDDFDQGLSLMERGAQMLLDHMMTKVEPSLQDMTEALKQAQPRIMELMAMIDDIKNFHAPELLPNGDILIRRKTPAEILQGDPPGAETEL